MVANHPLSYTATSKQSEGHFMDERITIDPKVCHGQACIKGTRIPVHLILMRGCKMTPYGRWCSVKSGY